MANGRDINLDIVGHDKTGRATRSAAGNLDQLKRKADSVKKSTDRMATAQKALVGKVTDSAAAVAKMAGAVSAVAAIMPGAALGIGKAAIAIGKFLAQVGPAAAALLPLAAGVALVKATLAAAGPAMLKAIEPVTKAWDKQSERVGRLASKGLRPLAAEFVKVNFPAIAKAQDRIAKSTNDVVRYVGKWVNSAAGQKVISQITRDTAATFERLAPAAGRVATSLAKLAGRASGTGFKNFGDAADYALNKIDNFINSISGEDIAGAFEKIRATASAAGDGLRKLGDALQWVQQNEDTINKVRTALAGLAIVVGIATGGWMIALGGAAALITMNWDKVTATFERVRTKISQFVTWVKGLDSAKGTFESIRTAVDQLKQGFDNFIASVEPHVAPFLDRLQTAFIKLQPLLSTVASGLGVLGSAFLTAAGPAVAGLIEGIGLLATVLGNLAVGASVAASAVLKAFSAMLGPLADLAAKLKLPFADAFKQTAANAKTAADNIDKSVNGVKTDVARAEIGQLQSKINSLKGKKVKTEADQAAIASAQARIKSLQGTIDSLKGKTVTVTTYYVERGAKSRTAVGPGAGGQGKHDFASGKVGQLKFATAGYAGLDGGRVGGSVTVTAGPTNVDARVYIDGEPMRAIARTTVRNDRAGAVHRARFGRR